ncbi:MAG: hypothetical protein M0R69_02885, partial [Candidatus Cloacimonetes bacterium]|nr:hypothetical protein [Candidatus Cloacimonadota bacterium]
MINYAFTVNYTAGLDFKQQGQWLGLQTAGAVAWNQTVLQFHMKSKEPQNNWIIRNQERLFELHTEGIKQQEQ